MDRLRYVERTVLANQLKGGHQLGERHRLDWSLSSSGVSRSEPDRSEFVYMVPSDPQTGTPGDPLWFSISNQAAVRTFGDLSERSPELAGDYKVRLGGGADPHEVSVGGVLRDTERAADNLAYSISANLPEAARALRLFAGAGYEYVAHECEAKPRVQGENRLWENCRLVYRDPSGSRLSGRCFGSILEREGRFKIVSYTNSL